MSSAHDNDDDGNFLVRDRTRIFYDRNNTKANAEEFMEIFCHGGSLYNVCKNNIEAWTSPSRGSYLVTFKEINSAIKKLEVDLRDSKILRSATNKDFEVRIGEPYRSAKHVTLRPVPTEYSLSLLKSDIEAMGWGLVVNIRHGYHKNMSKWAHCKNFLVHLKLANINLSKIPNVIKLRGHEIYVTKPGENIKNVCSFCHKAWHVAETCWAKRDAEAKAEHERQENERLTKRKQYLDDLKSKKVEEERLLAEREQERQKQQQEIEQILAEKSQLENISQQKELDIVQLKKNKEVLQEQHKIQKDIVESQIGGVNNSVDHCVANAGSTPAVPTLVVMVSSQLEPPNLIFHLCRLQVTPRLLFYLEMLTWASKKILVVLVQVIFWILLKQIKR